MTLDVVIGLGANLGDPVASFRAAARRLEAVLAKVSTSALYRSAPIGPAQPDFANAALRGTCELEPEALLELMLDVEVSLGRTRDVRWGPRTLDLDLLWIAGVAIATPRLVVPHPRLGERAFALRPLLELAPDARDPMSGRAYSECLRDVADQRIERVSEWRWMPLERG